jgi:hypothetical protein
MRILQKVKIVVVGSTLLSEYIVGPIPMPKLMSIVIDAVRKSVQKKDIDSIYRMYSS